eukprot:TRINITY_DN18169_c0_g1_i1.p1 TRINITY_DN18169_c0_g1~~TRINITY_DN18169_c0_g1_i1.p1  ORF type:complete len:386 (+),score=123.19 TRINITY_DN18169_c0_g1_i1:51-1160(+)
MEGPFDLGITAVFVSRFDSRVGNVVEWSYPPSLQSIEDGTTPRSADALDLDGVEFKSLVSGWHDVSEDYVLFNFRGSFGIAVYNARKDDRADRGVWQRSAGVLCRDLYFAAQHVEALSGLAAAANTDEPAPDRYQPLLSYFRKCAGAAVPVQPPPPGNVSYLRKIALCWGSLDQLTKFLGPKVFTLWRALLCGLRVLFVSRGHDVGVVCSQCHGALGLMGTTDCGSLTVPTQLYYVSVRDVDTMPRSKFYVACTTERIFVEMPQLWDVLVDGVEVKVQEAHSYLTRKQAVIDKRQYKALESKLRTGASDSAVAFFEDLNTQMLYWLERWRGTVVTDDDVEPLGLSAAAAPTVFGCMGYDVGVRAAACCK